MATSSARSVAGAPTIRFFTSMQRFYYLLGTSTQHRMQYPRGYHERITSHGRVPDRARAARPRRQVVDVDHPRAADRPETLRRAPQDVADGQSQDLDRAAAHPGEPGSAQPDGVRRGPASGRLRA